MPSTTARGSRRASTVLDAPESELAPIPTVDGLPLGTGLEPSELARPISVPGLSIETAAYIALVLVALLLRFWRLDDMPLSPDESRAALASLEVARSGRFPNDAGALLGMGNALVFAIAGATDALARTLPALLGGLIPLAFVPARRLLGRATALIAATLATFSPLLIDQSRSVGSAAIGATISTALVFYVFAYASGRRPRYLYWSAFLLALALTAGAAAFSTLIALVTFGLSVLAGSVGAQRVPSDLDAALEALAPANGHSHAAVPTAEQVHGRDHVLRAGGLFAATLLIVATGALIDIGGVGEGLFAPLGHWFESFAPAARTLPLWYGPLVLLAYEPLAVVLGAAGAVLAMRQPREIDRFLVWWLAVGLIVAVISPDRTAALAAALLPPAYVLSAAVIRALWERAWPRHRVAYLVSVAVLVWGSVLVLVGFGQASIADAVGVRYIAAAASMTEDSIRGLVIVLPIALVLGALGYLWTRLGSSGRPALGLAAATLLLAGTLHSGWNLAYQVVDNEAELPRSVQTAVDVRALARDVNEVVQVLTINRKEKSFSVADGLRYPLAWYLRDKTPRFEARLIGTPAMAILPLDAKAPSNRYSGQRYRVSERNELVFTGAASFWRWLLYRENPGSVVGEDVNLYVRAQ